MGGVETVGPGPLGPLAPVGMPPSRLHLLGVASPPAHHGRRLRALAVAMALRGGGEERLGTRLGLAGGGPTAFAQPEHARAASTQNSGRVALDRSILGLAWRRASNRATTQASVYCIRTAQASTHGLAQKAPSSWRVVLGLRCCGRCPTAVCPGLSRRPAVPLPRQLSQSRPWPEG